MKHTFQTRNLVAPMVAIAVIASTSAALAGEDIAISSLPEPVSKAVKERFPKAEVIKAEKESEAGQVKFEVEVRDEGKLKEAHVSPEGKILKIEDEK